MDANDNESGALSAVIFKRSGYIIYSTILGDELESMYM